MATHSSILAWRIPWTEDPGGLQSMESKELDMTEHTHTYTQCHVIHKCGNIVQSRTFPISYCMVKRKKEKEKLDNYTPKC